MLRTRKPNHENLQTLGDERIRTLVRELASRDVLTMQRARESLITLGKTALPELLQAANDPNDQVRWEAIRVLGEIRDSSTAPALVEALTDQNFVVRWIASEALASMGRRALIPLLRKLVEHPESVWLRRGTHRVLRVESRGELAKILDPVVRALEGIQPTLQVPFAAINALHELQNR